VMCDVCNHLRDIPYRQYLESFNKYGIYTWNIFLCSSKCSQVKNNNINHEVIGGIDNLCITKRSINSIKNKKTEDEYKKSK
jgi:hypothetical protein